MTISFAAKLGMWLLVPLMLCSDVLAQGVIIVTNPQDQTACPGSRVTFSVEATGIPPLRYSWTKDGVAIVGARSAQLILANVQASDAGTYEATVQDRFTAAQSAPALLQIDTAPPLIMVQPQSQTAAVGARVIFTISAGGCDPLQYQWYKDQLPLAGATRSSLTLNNVRTTDAGTYSVTVANANGTSTSIDAILVISPPTISDISDQTISEDSSTAAIAFTVGDVETAPGSLTVTATSSDGVLVLPGSIVLGGSGANRTVTVSPAANQFGSGVITVTVSDSDGANASDRFVLTVNPLPAVSIGNAVVTEGNSGTVNADLVVTLSTASSQMVTVSLATTDGTAVAPSDYTATSTTLTFLPLETIKNVTMQVYGDTTFEADETFSVILSNPFNAKIGDGEGTVTIRDDDSQPSLSVNDVALAEGNSGTANATFAVTLSSVSSQVVTASYSTTDGTATAPIDYISSSGTLTFAPGELSKHVIITVNSDQSEEPNETFLLIITAPVEASIADSQGVGTIVDDDGPPVITSIAPLSGDVGSTVIITGSGFSATAGNNIVYFGGGRAAVTSATTSSLSVTVPMAATYAPVSVTVSGRTAYSNAQFVQTFPSDRVISSASFPASTTFSTTNPSEVAVGDLDGDGRPELVVGNIYAAAVSVFRNTSSVGAISFAAKVDFATAGGNEGLAISDLDGDGKPDLITGQSNGASVAVLRNTSSVGSLSFGPRMDIGFGAVVFDLLAGDLDGDGRPDLVVPTTGTTISLFRNVSSAGAIQFESRFELPALHYARAGALGDLDGDGKPDIVIGNFNSQQLTIFKNTSSPGALSAASFSARVDVTSNVGSVGFVTSALAWANPANRRGRPVRSLN